jgi:RNase P subunit RPR2
MEDNAKGTEQGRQRETRKTTRNKEDNAKQGRQRHRTKMQSSMEHNSAKTRTKRFHHTARPTCDPCYSTVQMGCMCMLTVRNSYTVSCEIFNKRLPTSNIHFQPY